MIIINSKNLYGRYYSYENTTSLIEKNTEYELLQNLNFNSITTITESIINDYNSGFSSMSETDSEEPELEE